MHTYIPCAICAGGVLKTGVPTAIFICKYSTQNQISVATCTLILTFDKQFVNDYQLKLYKKGTDSIYKQTLFGIFKIVACPFIIAFILMHQQDLPGVS